MNDAIIRAVGLTKRFGDFTAVDDLTIEVETGTIFAFLGANGSGKSTTIRMLIGLLEPTDGSIEVDGIDVIHRPRRVRDHIGYMGQKVSLYQGLSLRENVEFYAGLHGLEGQELAQRWGALSERFELRPAENEKAEDLPAGVRQRAGLALSTLHQPRVLFLDEPTAGVDVRNRGLFWELIQEESDAGVTVFVTTHFLEEVDYCDRVAFIDAGRLIADASPAELRQRYSDGYDVEIDLSAADAVAALERLAARSQHLDGKLRAWFPNMTPEVLRHLDRLSRESGAHANVKQASMTEVFRRLLAQAQGSP
jgi:ABC-2 type transport system ATP-binding protein